MFAAMRLTCIKRPIVTGGKVECRKRSARNLAMSTRATCSLLFCCSISYPPSLDPRGWRKKSAASRAVRNNGADTGKYRGLDGRARAEIPRLSFPESGADASLIVRSASNASTLSCVQSTANRRMTQARIDAATDQIVIVDEVNSHSGTPRGQSPLGPARQICARLRNIYAQVSCAGLNTRLFGQFEK
jgi:hypothetical protein